MVQLHLLGLLDSPRPICPEGKHLFPPSGRPEAGAEPVASGLGPPRQLQTEALGAGGRGGRRRAQHAVGEAAKPLKDPDYFPLNEKQQQQQQLLPPRAPAPALASGDPSSKQLSPDTVNTAQLPQLSPYIKVPGVRGNLNI